MKRELPFRAALSAILAATLIAFTLPTAPSATPTSSEEQAFQEMADGLSVFLPSHGVSEPTRAALIAKLHSGILLNSMDGSDPVSTQTFGGTTVETFADGSVRELKVETPVTPPAPGGISPMAGIAGCSSSTSGSYSYRTNCLVSRWDGIISQGFHADFTYVTPGYDRIDSVYSPTYAVFGATSASQTYFGILKKVENASGAARAEHRVSAQLPIIGSVSYYLRLNVGAGGATAAAA